MCVCVCVINKNLSKRTRFDFQNHINFFSGEALNDIMQPIKQITNISGIHNALKNKRENNEKQAS
uniref:Uncharacterized protein n=1 Tax=Rhizophora mucronata TaxID=61149 RepID=A0A2P2QUM5_RHIMU